MSDSCEEGETSSHIEEEKIIIPPGEFRYPKNRETYDIIEKHIEEHGFEIISDTRLKEDKQMEFYVYPKGVIELPLDEIKEPFYRILTDFSTQTEKIECPTCGHIKVNVRHLCTFQEAEPLYHIVELDKKLLKKNEHLKDEIDKYTHGWERCDEIVIKFDPRDMENEFLDKFPKPLTYIERCMYDTCPEEGGWFGEYEWNYILSKSESGWIYIKKLGVITKFRYTDCTYSSPELLEEIVEEMPELRRL